MAKFILSCFADEISDDFQTQLDCLKDTKVRHIEIRNVNKGKSMVDHTLEEAREVKALLDKEGFKISAIGSPIGKIKITDDFQPHLEKFKHTLEIAKIMDTKYIRMFSFFIPEEEDPDQYKDEVIRRWHAFEETAKGTGIILLHENEKGIYGDTAERCLSLLNEMDSTIVQGIFDPANFVQCKSETYPKGFNLLKDKIVYMHIKDAQWEDGKVVPSGKGDGKIKEILSELVNMNFQGFLSLEPHLNDGNISVGGPDNFMIAYNALMDIINGLDVEVE